MKNALLIAMSIMLLSFLPVRAQDKPAEKPADKPAEEKSAATAPAGTVIEATDIETLKGLEGKEAIVHGTVAGTYLAKSGILLINFEGAKRNFVGMVGKADLDAVNAGFGGDVAAAIKDKSVLITGPIKLYKEKPEIVISKPEQIKVEAGGEEKKEEKKN